MNTLKIIEGVLPEQVESRNDRQWIEDYYDKKGFNRCRDQMATKLSELRKII